MSQFNENCVHMWNSEAQEKHCRLFLGSNVYKYHLEIRPDIEMTDMAYVHLI